MINKFHSKEFLNDYWQQAPLLVRDAVTLYDMPDADDLAGLAMEPEVESRLVQYDEKADQWSLTHGPFDDDTFANLPEKNWTLLVQAVDHWIDEVRDVMSMFRFLPQWRIDDIMISFATDGGSVGPHYDHYDVFLIQLAGRREWKIGQVCTEESECIEDLPMKVLTDFDTQEKWVLSPGDTLYLPPGVAHWGTSVGDSLTMSVGFRAPSSSEFISEFGHFLSTKLSEFQRYTDAKMADRSHHPFQLTEFDLQQLKAVMSQLGNSDELLAEWLGRYMTEPKYGDNAVDSGDIGVEDFESQWAKFSLVKNPSSRFAHYQQQLFVDGESTTTSLTPEQLEWICQRDNFNYTEVVETFPTEMKKVLWSLYHVGAVYFTD